MKKLIVFVSLALLCAASTTECMHKSKMLHVRKGNANYGKLLHQIQTKHDRSNKKEKKTGISS